MAPYVQVQAAPYYSYYQQPQASAPTYAYMPNPVLQSAYQSQAAMLQGMAPYNPSFVISQSNQLYNQHQNQQLNYYKPLPQLNENSVAQSHFGDTASASNQYYDVNDEQMRQIHNLHAAATQLQYTSPTALGQYEDNDSFQGYNSISEAPSLQSNPDYSQNQMQYTQDQSNAPYSQNQMQYTQDQNNAVYNQDQLQYTQDQNNAPYSQDQVQYSQGYTNQQSNNNQNNDETALYQQYQQQLAANTQQQAQDYAQSYFEYAQGQPQGQPQEQHPSATSSAHQQPNNQNILENEVNLTPQTAYEQHHLALQAQLAKATESGSSSQQLRIYVPDDADYNNAKVSRNSYLNSNYNKIL